MDDFNKEDLIEYFEDFKNKNIEMIETIELLHHTLVNDHVLNSEFIYRLDNINSIIDESIDLLNSEEE